MYKYFKIIFGRNKSKSFSLNFLARYMSYSIEVSNLKRKERNQVQYDNVDRFHYYIVIIGLPLGFPPSPKILIFFENLIELKF